MQRPACCQRIMMLGLLGCALLGGCAQTNPAVSSASGRVHFVVIDDGVSDAAVRARAGEEVRWVNVRTTPVSVVFNGLKHAELSCGHGFSNSTSAHLTAVILPDHNASLCFSAAGRHAYQVLDGQRPGVELNHEATVEVAPAP